MPLSRFPEVMPLTVQACVSVTERLRAVRDSTGDLPISSLIRVQAGLAKAKTLSYETLVEGEKQPAASSEFMFKIGGPATLVDFQSAMVDVETKASAWNVAIETLVMGLSASDLLEVITVGVYPVTTRDIRQKMLVPAVKADTLRASSALNDLIGSFEALGIS